MPDVFRALADDTRRVLLDELSERAEQTLFELCERLAMKHGLSSTRQAVSQHLDVLEQAGLVRTERRGRYKLHTLDTTPIQLITARHRWLHDTISLSPDSPESPLSPLSPKEHR